MNSPMQSSDSLFHLVDSMNHKRIYFGNSDRLQIDQHDSQNIEEIASSDYEQYELQQQCQQQQQQQQIFHQVGFSIVWRKSALRIIYLISRFLLMLKTSTAQYKFKLINAEIMTILGDCSTEYSYYLMNNLVKEKPNAFKQFYFRKLYPYLDELHIGVIKPDSNIKVAFDAIVLLLISMNLFYIPFALAFDQSFSTEYDYLLEQTPSVVFILEIVVKFNTAYFQKGVLHETRKEITRHYLKSDFWGDFVVVLPFLLQGLQLPALKFILLLRVFRITKIIENIEEVTAIREKWAAPIDLLKLIFVVIFVSHFCACIWHFIGVYELNNTDSQNIWIRKYDVEDANWQSRYTLCFYWSTITTLTVGFGDITPVNDFERVVCCIIVLFCSILFGYTISSIGVIFAQMREKNIKYKNALSQMNSYIKKRKLNQQLQTKVKKYFEYLFQNEMEDNDVCQQQMERLSHDLKREVKIDMYMKVLHYSNFLKQHFTIKFLEALCQVMRSRKCIPGEVIFSQGDLTPLYFILQGEMQTYVQQSSKRVPLRKYRKGFVVGIKDFLASKPIEYSAVAESFLEITYISPEDFLSCLRDNIIDFEKHCMVRHQIKINSPLTPVKEVCQICRLNHQLLRCPFTFYTANKYKIFKQPSQINERSPAFRKTYKTQNTRGNRHTIQEQGMQFMLENGLCDEQHNQESSEDILQQPTKPRKFTKISIDNSNNASSPAIPIRKQTIVRKRMTILPDAIVEQPHEIKFMEALRRQFILFVKEDSLPGLDRFMNFNSYFKEHNIEQLLSGSRHFKKKHSKRGKVFIGHG